MNTESALINLESSEENTERRGNTHIHTHTFIHTNSHREGNKTPKDTSKDKKYITYRDFFCFFEKCVAGVHVKRPLIALEWAAARHGPADSSSKGQESAIKGPKRTGEFG